MLIKAKVFEHYNNYKFKIPLNGGERINVKSKQKIEVGDKLFTKSDNGIRESYLLVDELICKSSECMKYVTCIDGSYVEEGDVLAQKTAHSGLTIKKIVAGVSGIVDLERLPKGFIDILGEEEESDVKSNVSGIIDEVLPGSHIIINSAASALDLVATTLFEEKLFGNLIFLTDSVEVITEIPEIDLKGKIVWAGGYLTMNLALKLFQRGVSAVVAYCMEYDDFRNLGLPVAIVEGFGKIHCDERFFKEFYKVNEKFIVLDGEENQLFVAKDIQSEKVEGQHFVRELLGSEVISRHSAHYGYIGTIVQMHDLDYVTVDFGIAGKAIVDIGSLDFISM